MIDDEHALTRSRGRFDWLLLYLKGAGMGAADIVPGVSGGTIAFITGIYSELVTTLTRFDLHALRLLFSGQLRALWQHTNAGFIAVLLLGIISSVITLARLIHYLLEHQPVLLAAFFIGLIAASSVAVARHIGRWQLHHVAMALLGVLLMWGLANVSALQLQATPMNIFLGAAIAICATILPGISGGFLLLLMGLYAPIIGAIKDFELVTVIVFAAGAATGLLAFSRLLRWLLTRYTGLIMALLTGVLWGSLITIWPWKQPQADRVSAIEANLSPAAFAAQVGDPQLLAAVGCTVFGLVLVLLIDFFGQKKGLADQ